MKQIPEILDLEIQENEQEITSNKFYFKFFETKMQHN